MSMSLDSFAAKHWAYVGLESSYGAAAASAQPIKLLSEPEVVPVADPIEADIASPYAGEPDRPHNLKVVEISLEWVFPLGIWNTSADTDLPPIHPLLLSMGLEYTDDPGVAGSEARTTTYTRRTVDQYSTSIWAYKLAENLDGSGNRLASEITVLGARGGGSITIEDDAYVTGTSDFVGLVDQSADGPFWQDADVGSNLEHSIPALSDLNGGRKGFVSREGTLVQSPFSAEYIQNVELSFPASAEQRRATAGAITGGVVDEVAAVQDGAPEMSFSIPQVQTEFTPGGLWEMLEDTGLNNSPLEIEYTETADDAATQDSTLRILASQFRPTDISESSVAGMGVWDVTGMLYASAGDDEFEIDVEATEA